jgi:hypothetical protein
MNFDELAELNTSRCLNERFKFKNIFDYHLVPNRPFVLDKSLNIYALNDILFGPPAVEYYATFQNILGIDLNFYGYTSHNTTSFDFITTYTIVDSTFDFYLNNEKISECDHAAFVSLKYSVFGPLVNLNIGNNVKFGGKVSPLAFNNSFLSSLSVSIVDHYVFKTLLEFCNDYDTYITQILDSNSTNDTQTESSSQIKSVIEELTIFGYNYKLETSLLHPIVFRSLLGLNINGKVKTIQTDLFLLSPYQFLDTIDFNLRNLKQFFHNVGFEWTKNLNINASSVCFTNQNILMYVSFNQSLNHAQSSLETKINPPYQFPDTDFCIFSSFPVNRSVVFSYETPIEDCSCLYFWLIQNYPCYAASVIEDQRNVLLLRYLNCANKSDNFKTNCLNTNSKSLEFCDSLNRPEILQKFISEPDISDYDIEYSLYIVQFIFNVILLPLFCILGFFSNALTIYVVTAQAKELKEPFFDYMKLNSLFNCIYCVIFLTTLMNECIMFNGIYCSSVRTSLFAQWYKILVVEYFGDAIKICSNVTYILMNVNRYMLIGRDHNKTLQSISELNPKTVNICLFLFSSTLSIVKALPN